MNTHIKAGTDAGKARRKAERLARRNEPNWGKSQAAKLLHEYARAAAAQSASAPETRKLNYGSTTGNPDYRKSLRARKRKLAMQITGAGREAILEKINEVERQEAASAPETRYRQHAERLAVALRDTLPLLSELLSLTAETQYGPSLELVNAQDGARAALAEWDQEAAQ